MKTLDSISPAERRVTPKISLSPSQRKAAEGILLGLERGDYAVLQDSGSDGKTTVLDHVHQRLGGVRIGVREFCSSWRPMNLRRSKKHFSI
jgi:hypothetical protein